MAKSVQRGSFRIIGGAWRRRRLDFVTDRDVRPSPDRVRETLFNWLAPVIEGARCLDLFAGSGALGLEALSRGASHVVFVDRERSVIDRIRGHLVALDGMARAELIHANAEQFLARPTGPFDIVFLDPPFHQGRVALLLPMLAPGLKSEHRVYVETEAPPPELPPDWEAFRSARAGRVSHALVRYRRNPHNS